MTLKLGSFVEIAGLKAKDTASIVNVAITLGIAGITGITSFTGMDLLSVLHAL